MRANEFAVERDQIINHSNMSGLIYVCFERTLLFLVPTVV